jgi:hypothetical protein
VDFDEVGVQRLLVEAAGFANAEDSLDEPLACGGLGAVAGLAPQDGVADRALGAVVRGLGVGVLGEVA